MKDLAERLGEVGKEFKNKIDFCVSANIPVQPFDIQFFEPITLPFMVGPVPMSVGK